MRRSMSVHTPSKLLLISRLEYRSTLIPQRVKGIGPLSRLLAAAGFIVLGAVQFYDDLCAGAVEIDDVFSDYPLSVYGDRK